MSNLIKQLQQAAGHLALNSAVEPVGLDFDGTNDYLSRSSDLTGNADGKTFTFSAWLYSDNDGTTTDYIYESTTGYVRCYIDPVNRLYFYGMNSSGTFVFGVTLDSPALPKYSWVHIIISCDLTNTSNRHVYLNDAIYSSPSWNIYTNDNIDFTRDKHSIGARVTGESFFQGRLANVFLDYTYRDLSVEANRRLFNQIDSTRGLIPSSTVPSNPIIYLPMDDPDDQGRNDGTGGNFTVNGDPSQSQRGANQYNVVASEFDGSADYLARTNLTNSSGSKTFTIACTLYVDPSISGDDVVFSHGAGNGDVLQFNWNAGSTQFDLHGYNSSGTQILDYNLNMSQIKYKGRHIHFAISIDLSNATFKKISIDGVPVFGNTPIFTNDTIDFNSEDYAVGARSNIHDRKWTGQIGDFYFDTTYIDLSTSNPFWDSDNNKPAYLGEQGEIPTGSQPLIYLPLRADDAGNNLGSGGDFTVNSGPYTGARGYSEYWARSAYFGALDTNPFLSKSAVTGTWADHEFTLVVAWRKTVSGTYQTSLLELHEGPPSGFGILDIQINTSGVLDINGRLAGGGGILDATSTGAYGDTNWHIMFLSIDLRDTSKRKVYIDENVPSMTWTTYNTGQTLPLASTYYAAIGELYLNSHTRDGEIGFFYFNTHYTDFSVEDNRRLFVDALGYPVDLQANIDDGLVPNPLIYMKFDDTDALGTNSGTGGDFTVNGTVTAGADVKG